MRKGFRRPGFSLLEVILALAILVGILAVLNELVALGVRNARVARAMTQVQLLCESKLAEINAGITAAEPVTDATFTAGRGGRESEWVYSIDLEPTNQEGLTAICITFRQDLPERSRPVEFSLVRWIYDPNADLSDTSASKESGFDGENGGGGRE